MQFLAQLALAETYRQLSNFDEAKRVLGEAALAHPESPAPPLALGRVEIEDAVEPELTE